MAALAAMTPVELAKFGKYFAHFPTQASLDNMQPYLVLCQKYEDRSAQSLPDRVHGIWYGPWPDNDLPYGDAYNAQIGRDPFEVAATPTVGKVTLLPLT